MHLLATQSGVIDDGTQAVDLGQTPGDVVVISAADSELSALARAHDVLGPDGPSLRLANQMQLQHNMSVDLYLERTLAGAKLVVLRLLGGKAYWAYGLERTIEAAREQGFILAVLPGDGQPDPELLANSTMQQDQAVRLWRYLTEGGPRNIGNFLCYCRHILRGTPEPDPPLPLLKSGLYWPGLETPSIDNLKAYWIDGAPVAAITFYRALIEGGNMAPVDALIFALRERKINAMPIFVTSLKDPVSAATIRQLFSDSAPRIILNATGFAVSANKAGFEENPLGSVDCPVLQVVFSGSERKAWQNNVQGLSARDLAMNVVLPELDGRVLTRAVSFKSNAERHGPTQFNPVTYAPEADRIAFSADLAANWLGLNQTPAQERKVAIILANYPNRNGRIGNGVGYDTPQSTIELLQALAGAGYHTTNIPADGTGLIEQLLSGATNRLDEDRQSKVLLGLEAYLAAYAQLPCSLRANIEKRWGAPSDDPFVRNGAFHLSVKLFGNAAVAIQPARGYNIDPKGTYHDPALVPPHGYLAFYIWLREVFGVHAIVHNGKHGNLEWLPGKALALSAECYPEAVLGPVPNIYPFIVNDPGEGSQAKRRTSAVIVDHLTPPMTRAESYGPLKDLEALIDEYYLASGLDQRRVKVLREHILDLACSTGLDEDASIKDLAGEQALEQIDNYICELKEAPIRDGLHILGQSPQGRLQTDLLVALARVPRNLGAGGDASLIRALSNDLGLGEFNPLDCRMGEPWKQPKPACLAEQLDAPWRTVGDTVERLEALAGALVSEEQECDPNWEASAAVMDSIRTNIRPALEACGRGEIEAMLTALDGRFVSPGPSGAPTRGRLDVLPTGRNFYSIDNRTVPTPAAWTLGEKSASLLVERFLQDHGHWPQSIGLSVWGTSNMRTGGDDIAQAMALIGVKPKWDHSSWRVIGFQIIPIAQLGRPRVDVTLRVSGFFRDAFPTQIDLFDSAVRAIGAIQNEEENDNPIAAQMLADRRQMLADGLETTEASRRAGFRVFGSKPGAYGAGLQALIDEKIWDKRGDLAESYVNWGGYAYGGGSQGVERFDVFRLRLSGLQAVVHNQDNREHDLFDSDDYYQFEGGMTAAVEQLKSERPQVYHNDHSRPERPVIRTLEEEIGRVVRSRVVNPKWIAGVMRHGYRGAFEIAATLDYMFAFAATTGAVRDHHFQMAYDAFIADDKVREFIAEKNAPALRELSGRFCEAIDRDLWTPRSNSAYHRLQELAGDTVGQTV